MLAYTRKKVIFQPYADPDEVKQILADEQILELHLFDRDREYRAIASRSPRFQDGVIETIADFEKLKENFEKVQFLDFQAERLGFFYKRLMEFLDRKAGNCRKK